MPVLVAADVVAIQQFVFGSNRLRDVAGASGLVAEVTSDTGRGRQQDGAHEQSAHDGVLSRAAAAVGGEIIVAAGGNALVRVDAMPAAREFAGRYSRSVLDAAPGLGVVLARREYADGELVNALRAVQVDLAALKARRRPSVPLGGLGVTAMCQATGRPASQIDLRTAAPVSPVIAEARGRSVRDRHRWRDYLPDECAGAVPVFPLELDDLGRTLGTRSLLGIVHVDGNSVGAQIRDWFDEVERSGLDDDEIVERYRQWSDALSGIADGAFRTVIDRVAAWVEPTDDGGVRMSGRVEALGFELPASRVGEQRQVCLPVRPILLGGDDLTFVCDGRLALDLAVAAAEAFTDRQVPHLRGVTACAGVAILPLHTPFVRGYKLAEQLCRSAKDRRRAAGWAGGAVDWHVGAVRPGARVEALRRAAGTCRPYPLDGDDARVSWPWLRDTLLGAGAEGLRGPVWAARRTKIHRLADVARDGAGSRVARTLDAWRVSAPDLGLPAPIARTGFDGGRTPLIDAAELLDRAQAFDIGVPSAPSGTSATDVPEGGAARSERVDAHQRRS